MDIMIRPNVGLIPLMQKWATEEKPVTVALVTQQIEGLLSVVDASVGAFCIHTKAGVQSEPNAPAFEVAIFFDVISMYWIMPSTASSAPAQQGLSAKELADLGIES